MRGLGDRGSLGPVARAVIVAATALAPNLAVAQGSMVLQSFELPLDQPAVAMAVPEGGLVRVSGTVLDAEDGTTYDAASRSPAQGRRSDGGLVDGPAGGFVLAERDPASNTYTYRSTGVEGPTCRALLLGGTCIVVRVPEIAAARLRDVDELREHLVGSLRVEVLALQVPFPSPNAFLPSPPPNGPECAFAETARRGAVPIWMWAVGGASSAGLLVALIAIAVAVSRRRKAAEGALARAHAAAERLRRRLGGDPVRARLLRVVDDLATEASSLDEQQRKLLAAVRAARPDELVRRREALARQAAALATRGGQEAGQSEIDGAIAIVEGQLDRCRRWEMQSWRCGARIERVATRLEALEVEVDDPTRGRAGEEDHLLDALQEELELARAGEEEAEQVLHAAREPD